MSRAGASAPRESNSMTRASARASCSGEPAGERRKEARPSVAPRILYSLESAAFSTRASR
eukprot:scaffold49107_cov33-Phaeocystis_antarctica.AAC.1